MNHAEVSPAFVASRAGYDVWLGNNRGNKYSHSSFDESKTSQDYWDYSFIDMGDSDIPVMIQYVLNVTKQEKLAYVAHSQGTTQMYYALATNEEFFASRVSIFLAFGPVARVDHCKSSMIRFFASNITRALLVSTSESLGIYEWFPANYLTTGSMRLICDTFPKVCEFAIYLSADENMTLSDEQRVQVYLGHYPSGTSLKSINHFGQLMETGRMQKYDYGTEKNIEVYGSEIPTQVDITKISKVPIGMFVGTEDELADKNDAQWTQQ